MKERKVGQKQHQKEKKEGRKARTMNHCSMESWLKKTFMDSQNAAYLQEAAGYCHH